MSNHYKKFTLAAAFFLGLLSANAQNLVHYWNFNNNASAEAITTVSSSMVTGAAITASGTATLNFTDGTGQNFNVLNLNAQNGDPSGTHLRFDNPIGGVLVFSLPTTGFENVIVKFATRRSSSGAGNQLWSYSTDGTNYTAFVTIAPNNGDPTLQTLDFSALTAVNNNANFKLKVEFEQGTGGTVGNNRFDNFTLNADSVAVPVLVHYWNFNNNASAEAITTVNTSLVTGAAITASGTATLNFTDGTGQNFSVLNLNARNGDVAGTHLRFDNPIGGVLIFSLPTTGFENVIVKFATRRSNSGAGNQLWSYSTDGTNYTAFVTIAPNNGDPTLQTLDFSALTAVNNNANFKLKVEFEQGTGGTVGNNRFDNFTLDATAIGGGDAIAPVVVITPATSSQNVAIDSNITLAFNENIRLLNNDAISDTNVDAVVELRLDNAMGALVPFDATYTGNTITINPSANLDNGQTYYVRLLANTVEDMSGNAVATDVESSFTTISVQTAFLAGDLVFVAFRTSATSTEDEIALLTLKDITPGTFINLTDSKYTTNATPQCPNGIVWTAAANECIPSGSVISIQTNALVSNMGTVTGSGFGLSSGGDQVIVYTGTNTAPNYITALSTNGWVASNTSCSGSLSMIPAGLVDGQTAFNGSTISGNVSGNMANAFYNGTQTGTVAELKAAIQNPANWTGVVSNSAAQIWPTWSFPSTLKVLNAVALNNTTIAVTFNNTLDAVSAAQTTHYTGVPGLASVAVVNNTATLTFSTPFAPATNYSLTISNISDSNGDIMACPYVFEFAFNTAVSMVSNFITAEENAGTLTFVLNLAAPATSSVDLVVKTTPFSTADAADFTLSTQTLTFSGTSSLTQTIAIPIIDDTVAEQHAEYFVLSLENPVGLSISGNPMATVFIRDNDSEAPEASEQIELNYVGSFDPSGSNSSTCEIVVHDPTSQRLFTTSAVAGFLDVINFSDPTAPTVFTSIDMNPYGGVTSVAVKNGVVAVASPNLDETLNGSVVFFNTDGVFLKQVTVGALPDNISFTADGTKVLTANEGQPNDAYTIDPEGSVSIIDISGGVTNLTQSNVTTLLFTAFNSQETALIASGVRKTKATSTMSQDFEPEFITSSADSQTAWVTIQENNAIGKIDLVTNTITNIWPLGTKDVSVPGNGMDISDNNNEILIANWPVKAFYMPDGIANYTANGATYLVTANEGDEKEYTGLNERTTVGASTYTLDPAFYPNASVLKQTYNMGRFRVTNLNGNTDADTDFEQMYCNGSRSFSIWNATTGALVYDSADDFERYTAASYTALFNADHENNTPKGRSRAKGPEPEGVTTAIIGGQTFAFISLERVGGVMVYNITDPDDVSFVDYKNSRSTSAYAGDHGPEGIIYITPENSPTNTGYVLVANEISGTISIFEVDTNALGTPSFEGETKTFALFPNPSNNGIVYFNRTASVEVFDLSGKLLFSQKEAQSIDTAHLATGIYFVKTTEGTVKRLIVR